MNKECYAESEDYWRIFNRIKREQDAHCPFCGKDKCEHWDGIAWINPKYKKGLK